METNKHYEAPEAILVEFKSEGVLCGSTGYAEEYGGGGLI